MRGDGGKTNRLRVGVIVDADALFDAWEVRLFDALATDPRIHLAFITALPDPAPEAPRSPWLDRILAWETRVLGRGGAKQVGLTLTALVALTAYPPSAKRHKPADILLNHARQRLGSELALRETAIWSYSVLSPGLAPLAHGLSAVAANDGDTALTVFTQSSATDTPTPLATARTNTKPVGSYNAAFATDILPTLVMRELETARLGLEREPDTNAPAALAASTAPTLPTAFPYSRRVVTNICRAAFDESAARLGARTGQWSLLLGEGSILDADLSQLEEIGQPAGEYRADPFLYRHGSDTWVFYEAFGPNYPRGVLHAGRLDMSGSGAALVDIQPLNFGPIHVSFPFVFDHKGETYMVPETHQRGRVEVWRCVEFPGRWVLHAAALEDMAPADSVLFEHCGAWWMFTSLGSGEMPDYCRELHVFKVDGPDLSGLVPHARNPVVIDTTCARMGGRPFVEGGVLYRPGQNSSYGLYGYGAQVMAIDALSLTTYRERLVRTISPVRRRGTTGCHHIDVGEGRFILDARRAYGHPWLGGRPIALEAV